MNYKKILLTVWLAVGFVATGIAEEEADSLGLPGDNLDLYGVLEIFKGAESMEEFEKAINRSEDPVNNLDLNEDGEVDYIRVVDHVDGDVHAIILQVPVSEDESQDVAAIEIEKTGDEEATLQIVGDEELYGADYIIEPQEEDKSDKMPAALPGARIVFNVWLWPSVRFVYAPGYRVWVSPWRWRAYPRWWRPWRPVAWRVHHRRCVRYHHRRWHRVGVRRCVRAHRVYHTHRRTSATVRRRHAAAHKRHQARKAATPARTAGKASPAKTTASPRKATASPRKADARATTRRSDRGRRTGTATRKSTTPARQSGKSKGAAPAKRGSGASKKTTRASHNTTRSVKRTTAGGKGGGGKPARSSSRRR